MDCVVILVASQGAHKVPRYVANPGQKVKQDNLDDDDDDDDDDNDDDDDDASLKKDIYLLSLMAFHQPTESPILSMTASTSPLLK